MKTKIISVALLIAILFGAVALPTPVAAKKGLSTPITGAVENGGTFEGKFEITNFEVRNNKLVAVGTLSGKIYDAAGKKVGNVHKTSQALPVSPTVSGSSDAASTIGIAATCDILHLVLGPLHLELLGLQVDLDTVVLDIVANPANGLLGGLLCPLATLLGPPLSDLFDIAALLNQILDLLN